MKSSQMAFTTYQEVSGPRRRGRTTRRVMAGEGMLRPSQSFTFQGERYNPATTRVSVDHPVCQSPHADLLVPAYEKESGHAVLEFLERTRGRKGQRRAKSPHDYWKLDRKDPDTRPSWRLD
jgi:hypothetical protein